MTGIDTHLHASNGGLAELYIQLIQCFMVNLWLSTKKQYFAGSCYLFISMYSKSLKE